MMNPTDLDARFMNHAARVAYADRFGQLYPATRPTQSGPRRLAAGLLARLSVRLAPKQVRQTAPRDTIASA